MEVLDHPSQDTVYLDLLVCIDHYSSYVQQRMVKSVVCPSIAAISKI